MTPDDQIAFDIVRKLFKNDYGEPFEMTLGQVGLFRAIYERQNPRIQFDCYTQYGKSDVVSMAVLLRATTFPETWPILGATKDKAGIIMGKLIKHIFENDYTLNKFQVAPDESLDLIRRTRAKDDITFKIDDKDNFGRVLTLSADARRKSQDAGDILIGHGAQNLIEDDAALIPDPIHGKALRMLGGHKDNFLLKVTNSFGRNHAYRSRNDPHFKKFVIDYKQGLAEGRLTEEYVTEMRTVLDSVMFGVLYECKYPPSDMIDDKGWMSLLTPEQVEAAQARSATVQSRGFKKLGVDVAEGTNSNAFVIRTDNVAYVHTKNVEKDLMKTTENMIRIATDERVPPGSSWVDAVAIGSGVASRAKQLSFEVNAFKGGESPTEKSDADKIKDPIEFYNMRAECYWKLRQWVLEGGALTTHPDWNQLAIIKYKVTADKKIQIMSKEEMRARGDLLASESTDVPDALSMTFAPSKIITYNMVASAPLKPYYPEIGI